MMPSIEELAQDVATIRARHVEMVTALTSRAERADSENARLRRVLFNIHCELNTALVQEAPSDDKIIMDHIREAKAMADVALKMEQTGG